MIGRTAAYCWRGGGLKADPRVLVSVSRSSKQIAKHLTNVGA